MSEQQADYATKSKTIFRTIKNEDHPFVMIDRRPVENPDLSWGAKGVLSYLLSRPDNWTVRLGDLVKRSTDGTSKIRGYIKELVKAGHAHRVAHKDPETHRIIEWVLEVYELPFTSKATPPISTRVAFHQVENRTLNNKDSFNKNDSKDIKEGASAQPKATDFPEVVLFRSVTGRYPARDTFQIVVGAVQKVKVRLNREVVCDDLLPFWEAWRTKDYRKTNLSWLTDWAVTGIIQNGAKHANTTNRQSNPSIDPEQLERDRALGERIKTQRAARQSASV